MGLISKPRVRWLERSRTTRKRASIRIKHDVQRHSGHLGGLFTSHDVIDGSSWADIYFLSRTQRNIIYNGTVDTALYAYFSKCENLAWTHSEALMSFDFEPVSEMFKRMDDGQFTLAPPKQTKLDAERRVFGGLTRSEWIDQEELRLADSGDVWVVPEAKLDFSYGFGVGLHAIVSHELLSVINVDAFVEQFLSGGELEQSTDSMRISYPSTRAKDSSGINAISTDPSEWAPSLAQRALALEERDALETGTAQAADRLRETRKSL